MSTKSKAEQLGYFDLNTTDVAYRLIASEWGNADTITRPEAEELIAMWAQDNDSEETGFMVETNDELRYYRRDTAGDYEVVGRI